VRISLLIIKSWDTSNGKIGHFLALLFAGSIPLPYDIPCQKYSIFCYLQQKMLEKKLWLRWPYQDCANRKNQMKPWFFFTGTCFIQKIYAPSSSLLQGKHLPFPPSPLRLNIFRLFVILSLTQLYRYTPEIFLFSTATFKYKYRAPSDELDKNIQQKSHFLLFRPALLCEILHVIFN
jgi:hypothetical protein